MIPSSQEVVKVIGVNIHVKKLVIKSDVVTHMLNSIAQLIVICNLYGPTTALGPEKVRQQAIVMYMIKLRFMFVLY